MALSPSQPEPSPATPRLRFTQTVPGSTEAEPTPLSIPPPPSSSAGSIASLEDDPFAPPIPASNHSMAAAFAGPGVAAASTAVSPPQTCAHTVVISGGSGFNDLVCATPQATFVMPISDDGGSSSEIIRVLGGPSIGDIRSRLVRLIPTSHQQYGLLPTDPRPPPSNDAIHALLAYRLPPQGSIRLIKEEWLAILEGRHRLWKGIEPERRECIRGFLVHFESEILRRAHRNFNFRGGSIGNFFLAAAQKFFRSVSSAIFLFSAITLTSTYRGSRVIPAINTNHTATIAASLLNGEVLVGQCEISHPSKPRTRAVSQHQQQRGQPHFLGSAVRQDTIRDASAAAVDAAAALASLHLQSMTSPSPSTAAAAAAVEHEPMSRNTSSQGGQHSADYTFPGTPSSAIFDPFSEEDCELRSRYSSGPASARFFGHSPAQYASPSSPASMSVDSPNPATAAPARPLLRGMYNTHDLRTTSTTSIVGNAGDGLDPEERSDDEEEEGEKRKGKGKGKVGGRRRRRRQQQLQPSGSAGGDEVGYSEGEIETATEESTIGAHDDDDLEDEEDGDDYEGDQGDDQFREAVGNILFAKDQSGETANQPLPAPIERIFYVNAYRSEIFPRPSSDYLSVLGTARTLLYSCGSLWTSIIPCLALRNVATAIARSPKLTHKILLLNTTHDRESDGMDALGFVGAMVDTLNRCDVPPTSSSGAQGGRRGRGPSSYGPRDFITHIIYFPTGSIKIERAAIEAMGIVCVPVPGSEGVHKPRFTEAIVRQALIDCGASPSATIPNAAS
ncbi:hypothetical protein A4X06_0g3529 [Tilletia controversa]|uniref:Uncharacterized protein n=1 Tax=Tilletia controversa TaxID=13291 RepID=A0A8X7SXC2_9BASI|nr:hypothetical protein CF328_g4754 [Tilletia controversa]KAE8248781.1 hypothetical protein A4X06_0g3529 [Tilletia controversa]